MNMIQDTALLYDRIEEADKVIHYQSLLRRVMDGEGLDKVYVFPVWVSDELVE